MIWNKLISKQRPLYSFLVVLGAGTFMAQVSLAEALAPATETVRNCNETDAPIGPDDSTQKGYFTALYARGNSAPIEDFLKLWYPERDQKIESSYFLACEDKPFGSLRYDDNGFVVAGCEPDVLYSWQTWAKFSAIRSTFPDGADWQGSANPGVQGTLWATISAVSTYSYGSTPIRLKLKPGLKFANSFSPAPNQIDYPKDSLEDFLIRDQNVVESYSFGTPEQYDEIVKDILRISSGEPYFDYSGDYGFSGTGMARVYAAGVAERGPQDEPTLKARLLNMIGMILNSQGRIAYSKGACRNRAAHFETAKPTYINTYAAPALTHTPALVPAAP